jgi:methyl-accepting chemotaxis protein
LRIEKQHCAKGNSGKLRRRQRGQPAQGASITTEETPAGDSRSRRETLVGLALVAAFVFAIAGTLLLWQISDRVGDLEGGGDQAQDEPLPPPSGGEGRALIREFDDLTRRISVPLDEVLEELRRGRLGEIAPLLSRLSENTEALPETNRALNELIRQTEGLTELGTTLAALRPTLLTLTGGVGGLNQGIPGLAGGLNATRGQLGNTVESLELARNTITGTNTGLARLLAGLQRAIEALDRTRESLDRTNRCFETPVVCGADDAQPGAPPAQRRSNP